MSFSELDRKITSSLHFDSIQVEYTCSWGRCWLCGALCLWDVQDRHSHRSKTIVFIHQSCPLNPLQHQTDTFLTVSDTFMVVRKCMCRNGSFM